MKKLTSKIQIGAYLFNGVTEVTTESSWEQMTDTATITIPKRIEWQGKPLVFSDNPILKKGNAVKIELGYDDVNEAVFEGYLTNIHVMRPVKLDCQDTMWQLKKGEFTKAYRQCTLSQLLKDMNMGVPYEVVANHDLGSYRTPKSKMTPAQVLEDLRQNYFVKFFFRGGKLYAGLAYVAKLQTVHKLKFDVHVVENNLEFVKKEDVKIKIRCVIMKPDNKKEEFEVGDTEGEVRTLHKYNISKEAMKILASQEIERLKYDGFRGTLTIFGQPFIQHGDVVDINDPETPEAKGQYLVKKVSRSFSQSGYRQTIELEGKVT